MPKGNIIYIALAVCFFLFSSIGIVYSMEPVAVEFLYFVDPCPTCLRDVNNLFRHTTQVVDHIESDFENKALVKRIPFFF